MLPGRATAGPTHAFANEIRRARYISWPCDTCGIWRRHSVRKRLRQLAPRATSRRAYSGSCRQGGRSPVPAAARPRGIRPRAPAIRQRLDRRRMVLDGAALGMDVRALGNPTGFREVLAVENGENQRRYASLRSWDVAQRGRRRDPGATAARQRASPGGKRRDTSRASRTDRAEQDSRSYSRGGVSSGPQAFSGSPSIRFTTAPVSSAIAKRYRPVRVRAIAVSPALYAAPPPK